MKRLFTIRRGRTAQVAVYDALLFLMVVILISQGMVLYTVSMAPDESGFSYEYYQHMADTQRIMVEGLSLKPDHPQPLVRWGNATHNETRPLNEWVNEPEDAHTIAWVMNSLCELTWRNSGSALNEKCLYNTSNLTSLVDRFFLNNQLNGTEHAWMVLHEGEVVLFNSSADVTVETLPDDRWASTSDYPKEGMEGTGRWQAELIYFLWYP